MTLRRDLNRPNGRPWVSNTVANADTGLVRERSRTAQRAGLTG
jgi:hypothetical protein